MIIIKTKTGDIFVNDKEMVNVTHNRVLHTADIYDGKGMGTLWRKPPIEHVESVVYINEQTAKEWRDNGSELEYLRKENKSLELDLGCRAEIIKRTKERLRQLGHECVQWVQYYHENMPKDLCEQMRKRGEDEKAYVNDDEDWVYRHEWFQNHQKPEEIEADEVARLNTTIEAQAAEIRELKDEIKRMEANERMRKEFQTEVYPNLRASAKDELNQDGTVKKAATADMVVPSKQKTRLGCSVSSKYSDQFASEVSWQRVDPVTGSEVEGTEDVTDGGDNNNPPSGELEG